MEAKGSGTAKILEQKKTEILDLWIEEQTAGDAFREDLMHLDDLRSQSEEFLNELVSATATGNFKDVSAPEYKTLMQMLDVFSANRAKQGFSTRETALYIFNLKDALTQFLRKEYKDDPEMLNRETRALNRLIDSLGIAIFEGFVQKREEVIRRQQEEILELSSPVITIWDDILAVPLVGTLDSSRTQVVMRNMLQKIVNTGSSVVILDISGVPAVDTMTAQHLLKTVSAARLMGTECIISGIRPAIAETIVDLGIDLSGVITKATLAGALMEAFQILGMEVHPSVKIRG